MSSIQDNTVLEKIGDQIQAQLQESREYFSQQKVVWEELATGLTSEITTVSNQLDEWEEFHEGMQRRQIELRKEKQSLEERRIDLDARLVALDEQNMEIDSRRRQVERDLAQRRAEIESGAANDEMEAKVEALQAELKSLQENAESTSGQSTELTEQLAAAKQQQEQLQTQYKAARDALLASRDAGKDLQSKLNHAQGMLEKKNAHILAMDEEFQQKEQELRDQIDSAASTTGEEAGQSELVDQLNAEREDLINQLSALKREMYSGDNGDSSSNLEMESKVEELVSALENAHQRNSELENQVDQLSASGGGGSQDSNNAPVLTEGMSWEEQKAALLGETNNMSPLDRLTVDKAVQVTENVVAERDAEIEALKQQLAAAAAGNGGFAGAAAPAPEPEFDAELEAEKQAEIRKALQRAEAARAARDAEDALHNQQMPQRPRESRSLRDEMGL